MKVGAIILAAGFGTRLAPLTDHTPKPLLTVGEKPVATHLVERLSELRELDRIVVVVNDLHVDQWKRWQTSLSARSIVQLVSNRVTTNDDRPGAVVDLALGAKYLTSSASAAEWIIVLAGDNLLNEPLQPHLDAAVTARHPVVLCRDLGQDVPAGRFGEITVDESGLITRFREKPAKPESPLAATCSYVLPATVSEMLTRYLATGDADSPGRFVGWLANQQPVMARPIIGTYHDIGNHETLAMARTFYTSRR